MFERTDDLIQRLAASATPVRPLAHPVARAMGWLAIAVPYLALVAVVLGPRLDLAGMTQDPALAAGMIAGLVTTVVAAVAAFATAVPGYQAWRRAWLMLVPVAWLAWFVTDAAFAGIRAPSEVNGWHCLPMLLLFGAGPLLAIALLLRRGAPLAPTRSLLLGALAAGALADIGTRACHGTTSEAHMAWHAIAVALLVVTSVAAAPRLLRWQAS